MNRRILVWRKPNTELDLQNLQSSVKHGGGGVMVCGSMTASGVDELIFIGDIMDKYAHLNILKQNLFKSAEKLNHPQNFYFQQDRDLKYTTYIVRHCSYPTYTRAQT